jgi:hypothetical protein
MQKNSVANKNSSHVAFALSLSGGVTMFSRIAAGALVVCALIDLPAGAHPPDLLPNAFDHYALTFDVGE